MSKTKISAELSVYIEFEIDTEHLEAIQSEGWANVFYTFLSEEEAIAYIARLLIINGTLNGLDGHPPSSAPKVAKILNEPGYLVEDFKKEAIS